MASSRCNCSRPIAQSSYPCSRESCELFPKTDKPTGTICALSERVRERSDSRFSRQSRGILPPNLRLSAIIAFAIVALAGALFLAGFRRKPIEGNLAARGSEGVPVYAARAVPFDSDIVGHPRSGSVREATTKAKGGSNPHAKNDSLLIAALEPGKRAGLKNFSDFGRRNPSLTWGVFSAGASSNMPSVSSSFAAEESVQNLAAVPEPSTWISGIALALLVGARCFRARWHSHQRREAEKTLRSFSSRFGERS